MSYRFSLIRFVPDPARDEAINIGAIAGDEQTGDWDLRLISNFRRAKAIDQMDALGSALAFIARLEDSVEAIDQLPGFGSEAPSIERLNRLADEMQNIVQLTPPAPIVATSSQEALDLVFDELVVDLAARQFRFEKKYRAVRAVQASYARHGVSQTHVLARPSVAAGPYTGTFDFGVRRDVAVQLIRCWSFQLPNQSDLLDEIKSWAFMVNRLRARGGELEAAGEHVRADPGAEIAAVYVPAQAADAPSMREGLAAFADTGILALTTDAADQVGAHAARLLLGQTVD